LGVTELKNRYLRLANSVFSRSDGIVLAGGVPKYYCSDNCNLAGLGLGGWQRTNNKPPALSVLPVLMPNYAAGSPSSQLTFLLISPATGSVAVGWPTIWAITGFL